MNLKAPIYDESMPDGPTDGIELSYRTISILVFQHTGD